MKPPPALSIILASIALVQLGCWGCTEIGTPHVEKIVHGYYTSSSIDHVAISKIDKRSPSPGRYLIYSVQDLDWDDKFIVVKSKTYPRRDSGDNTAIPTWYIVDAINDQVYGPFSYDEYIQKRQELSVPNTIEQLKPEETTFEAYHRKHSQSSEDATTSWARYMPCIGGVFTVAILLIALGVWTEKRKQSL